MAYVKSYNNKGEWKPISLTEMEEQTALADSYERHKIVMDVCIQDAKKILGVSSLDQSVIQVAISLFKKRAKHSQYTREEVAREKFEKEVKENET